LTNGENRPAEAAKGGRAIQIKKYRKLRGGKITIPNVSQARINHSLIERKSGKRKRALGVYGRIFLRSRSGKNNERFERRIKKLRITEGRDRRASARN